jgi:hypothetical protein
LEAPELADHQAEAGHSGQKTLITFVMATLVLTCSAPKTPEMPAGNAIEVLKMHKEDCHPPAVK